MTDREKLIELLCHKYDHFCDQCGVNKDSPYIDSLADYLISNGVTFAKDTNVPSWIPVSERLPDKDGTYICFNRGAYGKWTQAVRFTKDARKFDEYTFKNKWKNQWLMYDSEYGYYAVDSITHWMPMPEPPKEE